MSELESKAVEILDKLEQLTTQYTPEIIDVTLGVVRVSGFKTLISNLLTTLVGLSLMYLGWWLWTTYQKKLKDNPNCTKQERDNWEWFQYAGATITSILGVICFIFSVFDIFDVWAWVSIFKPELALANKVLGF